MSPHNLPSLAYGERSFNFPPPAYGERRFNFPPPRTGSAGSISLPRVRGAQVQFPSPACGGGQGGGRRLIPMARPQIRPYGSWRSPVTADAIVAGVIGLSQIQLDGDDIYWVEGRPAEAGRNVIVRRRPDGSTTDITPRDYNARTRVHEYGGGAYVVRDGVVWFTNFKDQRLYRQDPGRPPIAITPDEDIRHADLVFDPRHQRLIAVREDHTTDMPQAVNTIVSLDTS